MLAQVNKVFRNPRLVLVVSRQSLELPARPVYVGTCLGLTLKARAFTTASYRYLHILRSASPQSQSRRSLVQERRRWRTGAGRLRVGTGKRRGGCCPSGLSGRKTPLVRTSPTPRGQSKHCKGLYLRGKSAWPRLTMSETGSQKPGAKQTTWPGDW